MDMGRLGVEGIEVRDEVPRTRYMLMSVCT